MAHGAEATGCTVRRAQYEIASALGKGRLRVREHDYREMTGRFEKIASVGMFERGSGRKWPAEAGRSLKGCPTVPRPARFGGVTPGGGGIAYTIEEGILPSPPRPGPQPARNGALTGKSQTG